MAGLGFVRLPSSLIWITAERDESAKYCRRRFWERGNETAAQEFAGRHVMIGGQMRVRRRFATLIVAALLTIACLWSTGAAAAPQKLDCVLTDTSTKPGSESRPVAVVFDEDQKTLSAEEGGRSYTFTTVTITYISISGRADDVSIGIDRSSLGIVWQQYAGDRVRTEFGHCKGAGQPAPADAR